MALKFVSPGMNGVPDRIVLMPDGKMAFVELKAPGKKMRPLQEKRKRMLERLGFPVYVVDNIEQIGESLMKYKAHDYQQYATDFIIEHPVSCLILDMGLGKTVITLTALWLLLFDYFEVRRILVIAPKRGRDYMAGRDKKGASLRHDICRGNGNYRERKHFCQAPM